MPIHGILNKKALMTEGIPTGGSMKPDSFPQSNQRHRSLGRASSPCCLLIYVVSIQVFCRYVLQDSLAWTEELARYLVIWACFFGCSFAMRTDSHLELSILFNFSGPRMKKYVKCFSPSCASRSASSWSMPAWSPSSTSTGTNGSPRHAAACLDHLDGHARRLQPHGYPSHSALCR